MKNLEENLEKLEITHLDPKKKRDSKRAKVRSKNKKEETKIFECFSCYSLWEDRVKNNVKTLFINYKYFKFNEKSIFFILFQVFSVSQMRS